MILAAIYLIVLHTVEGREVHINPAQITTMREARDPDNPNHFIKGVRCMISLTDGKFVTVIEECDTIRGMLK